jgi:tetratricopeptide (TPR) repeat protein
VFKTYLDLKPRDPWAFYHYATMLFLQAEAAPAKDFEPAKSHLNAALALDPDFAEAYLQMGIVAQAEGDPSECATWLDKAIRVNPNLPPARYRRALLYRRMGDFEKAQAEFELFQKLKDAGAARERQVIIESLSEQKK